MFEFNNITNRLLLQYILSNFFKKTFVLKQFIKEKFKKIRVKRTNLFSYKNFLQQEPTRCQWGWKKHLGTAREIAGKCRLPDGKSMRRTGFTPGESGAGEKPPVVRWNGQSFPVPVAQARFTAGIPAGCSIIDQPGYYFPLEFSSSCPIFRKRSPTVHLLMQKLWAYLLPFSLEKYLCRKQPRQ